MRTSCSSSTTSTALSGESARESVAWFVDHLPASFQLVLASRMDPALPLGALRAHGELLELRADELRFTEAEATEFLNGRLGLELDPADVALLVARTEGWPAGLYLAALSLDGKPDKHALVRAFDGTSAHVVDFLAGEVLAGYEPELQTFMLRTSVLERLCARALRRGARAADVGGRRWSRSRARTCSSCRSTAAAGGSGSITCSRRSCASSWSGASRGSCRSSTAARTRGTAPPARPTRRSTTRWRRACSTRPRRLITETWVHYANSGRTASVLDWLTRFPEELLDADRRLLLVKAWVVALRGRADEMRERRGAGARPRRARRRAAARRHGVASSRASRC